MFDEVRDNRLLTFLQRYIGKTHHEKEFANFYYCGSQTLTVPGRVPLVAVVKNHEGARFSGIKTCHNSWTCPRCTAKVMAKYGLEIACAIDAMSTWYNEYACMITLTLPHTKGMSCEETFTTLREAWRMMVKQTKKSHSYSYETKQGTKKGFKGNDSWGKFREELDIKHFVRIFEFTWGKNSWHPHIHALLWIPKDKFDTCVKYEDKLFERWWHCCEFAYRKYLDRVNPDNPKDNKRRTTELFNDFRKSHKSFYISKDETGKPAIQKSSSYITGWSSNEEMTRLHDKCAKNGHYTVFQILEKAYLNRQNEKCDMWMGLWFEHARTVKGVRRIQFSKSPIKDIIRKWKESELYFETVKKKFTDKEIAETEVVGWFTPEDWNTLSQLELEHNIYLKAQIIKLASQQDALNRINKLLKIHGIRLRRPEGNDKLIQHQLDEFVHTYGSLKKYMIEFASA